MATVIVKAAGGRGATTFEGGLAALPDPLTEDSYLQIIGNITLGTSSPAITLDTNGFRLYIEPFPGDGSDADQNWASNYTPGSSALRYGISGSAALLMPTDAAAGYDVFPIQTPNVTIRNMQISVPGSFVGLGSAVFEVDDDGFVLENSIVRYNTTGNYQMFVFFRFNGDATSGMTCDCRNNLFYFPGNVLDRQIFRCNSHASNVLNVNSNTIIVPSDVTWPSTGNNDAVFRVADSATINAYNNAIFGFSLIKDATSSGTITGDYNHSNAAVAGLPGGAGVNNVGSITFSQTQPFIDARAATFDAYPIASSDLEDSGGTALTTDALGTSRPQGSQDDAGMIEVPQSTLLVDLSSVPASTTSSGVNPTSVLGSLLIDLAGQIATVVTSGVNPTVTGSGASVTVDLSSLPAASGSAAVDPTVQLTALVINLAGRQASAATSVVVPTVIMPGMTIVMDIASAASSAIAPTTVAGGVTVDLAALFAASGATAVNPTVDLGDLGIDLSSLPASSAATAVNPVVLGAGPVTIILSSLPATVITYAGFAGPKSILPLLGSGSNYPTLLARRRRSI